MSRLEGIEEIRLAVKSMQEKYDNDRTQSEKDMAHLTKLLEESRRARETEHREHLITKKRLDDTSETMKRMAGQINELENKLRCCNLKIDGKQEDDREDLKKYVMDMAAAMGVNTINAGDIVTVYRIGKRLDNTHNTRQRPRTILITFSNLQKRNKFFYSRASLKNSRDHRGIYLNDDITNTTRKQRDDYRSVASLARSEGVEVRVHTDGVVLDGKKYLLSEPHTLPDRFSLSNSKVIEINGEIYFASEHAYLSNFFPSPICINDTIYNTAEHLYQALKCEQANEQDKLDKILNTPSPLEAKKIADSVVETPEWRARKEEAMERVVDLKFNQHPHLAKLLLATGEKPLNEATHNDFFGIGATLHGRELNDKSYRGCNKLGHILAAKRASIRTT